MAEKQVVRCMDCRHAALMQWFDNPVVAECTKRVFGHRFVAVSNRFCADFGKRGCKPLIKHYQSY